MRRDGCRERDAAPACALLRHLSCSRLRAEEGAGGIDVECLSPLSIRHVHGVRHAYDAGEADEVLETAKSLDSGFDALCYSGGVCDINCYAEDANLREVFRQS